MTIVGLLPERAAAVGLTFITVGSPLWSQFFSTVGNSGRFARRSVTKSAGAGTLSDFCLSRVFPCHPQNSTTRNREVIESWGNLWFFVIIFILRLNIYSSQSFGHVIQCSGHPRIPTNLNPMKTSRTLTTSHLESRPVLAGIALILTLTVLSPTAHPTRFFSQVPSHK